MESVFKAGYILRLTSIAAIVRFGRNTNLCVHVHVAVYRWYGLLAGVSC